jgi:hypothetical protein
MMVTRLRQRLVREREERRGRKVDPAWAHRTLLLRGYDPLSARARTRLDLVFASDDPLAAAAVPPVHSACIYTWLPFQQNRKHILIGDAPQRQGRAAVLPKKIAGSIHRSRWRRPRGRQAASSIGG